MNEPTKWVDQIVVMKKRSGAIQMCIDPQPQNLGLKRERRALAILDDLLLQLGHIKYFAKQIYRVHFGN